MSGHRASEHRGTQNWEALIEDFQELGFLSEDTDKDALAPRCL